MVDLPFFHKTVLIIMLCLASPQTNPPSLKLIQSTSLLAEGLRDLLGKTTLFQQWDFFPQFYSNVHVNSIYQMRVWLEGRGKTDWHTVKLRFRFLTGAWISFSRLSIPTRFITHTEFVVNRRQAKSSACKTFFFNPRLWLFFKRLRRCREWP